MKKGILIPVTSRTVEKKYHLRNSDIVQLSTDTHMLLRGIVMSDKGKGRYKVMVFDEVPDEVKDFELRPVRITEKSLLALHSSIFPYYLTLTKFCLYRESSPA